MLHNLRFMSASLATCLGKRFFHLSRLCKFPVEIRMPALSPTMIDGSIVSWEKQEGDEVVSGDVVCEVQTDKAVMSLETEEEGTLAKILVPANRLGIQVGDLIAVLASPGEDWKEVAASVSTASVSAPAPPASSPEPVRTPTPAQAPSMAPSKHVNGKPTSRPETLGPAVRRLLKEQGLDPKAIPATGPRGFLLKGDVLAYIAQRSAAEATVSESPSVPQPASPTPPTASVPVTPGSSAYVDIPLTSMRQTIAKRLCESKTNIPHSYVRTICSLDAVNELRVELQSRCNIKVSINDLLIKACALGLRLVPELNAISNGTSGGCRRQTDVDISMAVATPTGLITPILFRADQLPVSEISNLSKQLGKKARDGKLQPTEFIGGSFTISNLGMFGIRDFTAIINIPQVAILAVGAGQAIPCSSGSEYNLQFTNQMVLTLSVDSRHVDQVAAGRFLQQVSRMLSQHPRLLISDDVALVAHLDNAKTLNNKSLQLDDFDQTMRITASK